MGLGWEALGRTNLENESLNTKIRRGKKKKDVFQTQFPIKQCGLHSHTGEHERKQSSIEGISSHQFFYGPLILFKPAEYFVYGPLCRDLHPPLWVALGWSWQLSQSDSGWKRGDPCSVIVLTDVLLQALFPEVDRRSSSVAVFPPKSSGFPGNGLILSEPPDW
ncbi:transmembrane protein 100 isoform X1 [Erinaceus europaeus]|uniref:Transmembrane protein 100 isoform X1 n=1 Tax=Erinaceus europaeus TaxID=9365 RepID=A0ABM3YFA9_ERIEU|nr:transmembrane protein 100 isoform X1 [Erinaceus europaeus]